MDLPETEFAPKDITPETFFSDWLPKQFEKYKPIVEQLAGDIKGAMSIKVDDKEWTCTLSKEGLQIDSGLSDDALVTFILGEKDFVSVVTGERQMAMQPPGGGPPSPEKIPEMAKNNIETLKQIQGMLQFQVTDPEAGDFVAKVKFQGPIKDEADVSISMAKEDAEAMAAGEMEPQTAFMQGKVQIAGDMTILMQLMPLMMQ